MHVGLYFASQHIDELSLRDQTVVVIDVLRSGTTIAAALSNGAKEIIPVNTVERAVKISGSLFGDHILRGGERNGRRIEGFDLGNSPLEYTREVVEGKAIIYSTTNGSKALERARYAATVIVGGFINLGAIIAFLKNHKNDFVVLCSGNNGKFSMEDSVCAGLLIHRITQHAGKNVVLSDSAQAALALYRSFGNSVPVMVRETEHGRYLISLGFESDLEFSADVDSLNVLPRMTGSVIRLGSVRPARPGTAKTVETT